MSDLSFRRMSAIAAMLSLPLAAGNLITILLAVDFNLGALYEPLLLLHTGTRGAGLWRWSMILDVFGYYLLIVPLILSLRSWLRPSSPNWIDLFTFCLLAYCLIGASGAAILATATPPLIAGYTTAAGPQRAILEAISTGYADAVYGGLWNLLEEFLAGVGWIGVGLAVQAAGAAWVCSL